MNAQGEDVVAGIRTPQPIEEMRARCRRRSTSCSTRWRALEQHYRDMQDIEFTIEDGQLYLLQTRSAKRTAAAALKAAVDMAERGADLARGGGRAHRPGAARPAAAPDARPGRDVRGRGAGARTPRRARHAARSSSTPTRAEERGKAGESVILVRWETTPDDIHGMIQAKGVLTAHGGMTSHAAVVARGMGKPCVAGCEGLEIDADAKTVRIGGHELHEGDVITIDGGTGRVIVGEVPLVPPQINEDFETILGWADDVRRLEGARERRQRRRTPRRRASSARRASGSAAPSTCSSARSGCR